MGTVEEKDTRKSIAEDLKLKEEQFEKQYQAQLKTARAQAEAMRAQIEKRCPKSSKR